MGIEWGKINIKQKALSDEEKVTIEEHLKKHKHLIKSLASIEKPLYKFPFPAKIGKQGRISIPIELRRAWGLREGDIVLVQILEVLPGDKDEVQAV